MIVAEQRKTEWISVKDRLPDGQEEVLVYMPMYGSTMQVKFLTDVDPERKTWFCAHWTTNNFDEITHWMPLPQPPK